MLEVIKSLISRKPKDPYFDDSVFDIPVPTNVRARLAGIGEMPRITNVITLKQIEEAIRCSEIGESYYLFNLFRDFIEIDSHLQAEMGKRIMSFVGQNETIEPFDKKNKEDVKAAEVIEDMISNCDNWRVGMVHLATGHIWPSVAAEKIYEPVADEDSYKWRHPVRFRLKKLFPVPFSVFTYRVAYQNLSGTGAAPGIRSLERKVNVGGAGTGVSPIQDVIGHSALNLGRTNNDPTVLQWNPDDWWPDLRFYSTMQNGLVNFDIAAAYKPDPIRHVMHSANVATASLRENFGGLLRSVIPWSFYKLNLRDWMARGMERYGSPFAVAYANTSNKNVFDLLTKAFNQATKVNALIVPPQSKIELKEVQVTNMADAYVKTIDCCSQEQTKAILGQTMSTTVKGAGLTGGSGIADLQGEVRSEWTQFDKRALAETEWKQIFEPFLRLNGYKGRCKVIRGGLSPAMLAVVSKCLQSLALAGVFVDEEAEQDLTGMFGLKMKIRDITQMNAEKVGKSKSDKKNYNE